MICGAGPLPSEGGFFFVSGVFLPLEQIDLAQLARHGLGLGCVGRWRLCDAPRPGHRGCFHVTVEQVQVELARRSLEQQHAGVHDAREVGPLDRNILRLAVDVHEQRRLLHEDDARRGVLEAAAALALLRARWIASCASRRSSDIDLMSRGSAPWSTCPYACACSGAEGKRASVTLRSSSATKRSSLSTSVWAERLTTPKMGGCSPPDSTATAAYASRVNPSHESSCG